MRTVDLKHKILLDRLYAILFLAACLALSGFFVVKKHILAEAQRRVSNDLRTVRTMYTNELARMKLAFDLMAAQDHPEKLAPRVGLDYFRTLDASEARAVESPVVRQALEMRYATGATRIIPPEELERLFGNMSAGFQILIRKTPKARPTTRKVLEGVMALEYAYPILDSQGRVERILCGGRIINRNHIFIDGIVDAVFEKQLYNGKPIGTVTVFQDDVRIATNVLGAGGQRAIGTRVSDVVYHQVVEKGRRWLDRAFVVTDWYITAYEPVRDIRGNIIGILYVGILEKPFMDIGWEIVWVFLLIIFFTSVLAAGLSVLLARSIHQPIRQVVHKAGEISEGRLDARIQERTSIRQLNELIDSFNVMAEKLAARENSLAISNKKLADLNKDYLELVGFVSHELKGILSSIVMNTYLLKDKILGDINEQQAKTLESMSKNLDYLAATVKNFLNLSRMEKGELKLTPVKLDLSRDIFKESIEAFRSQAQEKRMTIANDLPQGMHVVADRELMQIVANNLIGNAVKYGRGNGSIRLTARRQGEMFEVEVYNDGRPIADSDIEKLFNKFSRIIYEGMEKVKGTGVGLYITKNIIERHGGRIWVEPHENGNAFKFKIKAGTK